MAKTVRQPRNLRANQPAAPAGTPATPPKGGWKMTDTTIASLSALSIGEIQTLTFDRLYGQPFVQRAGIGRRSDPDALRLSGILNVIRHKRDNAPAAEKNALDVVRGNVATDLANLQTKTRGSELASAVLNQMDRLKVLGNPNYKMTPARTEALLNALAAKFNEIKAALGPSNKREAVAFRFGDDEDC